MPAVKVSSCGSVVRVDFGTGFITVALTDSITPFSQSKSIVETPDLTCLTSAEIGREEQSTLTFTHYWDPQDTEHLLFDTNFSESLTDRTKRNLAVQLVTPQYRTDVVTPATKTVTWEATCQLTTLSPEELTPDGFYKRTITMLRRSAITRTVATIV